MLKSIFKNTNKRLIRQTNRYFSDVEFISDIRDKTFTFYDLNMRVFNLEKEKKKRFLRPTIAVLGLSGIALLNTKFIVLSPVFLGASYGIHRLLKKDLLPANLIRKLEKDKQTNEIIIYLKEDKTIRFTDNDYRIIDLQRSKDKQVSVVKIQVLNDLYQLDISPMMYLTKEKDYLHNFLNKK